MAKEYIEREALEVALNHRLNFLMAENGEYDHYTSGFDEAVTRVENFPAADVAPVVRCQNCMYWTKMKDSAQGRCALFCHYPTGGWYCANGERKEDE